MNKILLSTLLLIPLLFGCKGKNESTPTYLHVETIDFQYDNVSIVGNGGTAISDVWIYDNDNLLGVFELPATVALDAQGEHDVTIRGGIKLNGISATREFYPFYQPWINRITLGPLDTTTIEPVVKYYVETGISFYENFEDVVLKIDSTPSSDVPLVRTKITGEPNFLENYVGLATITSDKPGFKAYTKDLFMVPTSSTLPIYLELDYKCNQEFVVAAVIQEPGTGTYENPILTLRSTVKNGEMQWKHVYIDLTDYFAGQVNATGFGFSFTALYNSGNPEGYIYLDNTKVVNTK